VTTLANGYVTAGNHSTLVNAEKLASGIYLLKFESDNYTTSSKLIIE
jgi:5-hydroxyisourate hydrolase-like protein (transthyretin family)